MRWFILCLLLMIPSFVFAQGEDKACQTKLEEARTLLKDASITENLLESELSQKRKQVASLGRQLQEERKAHEETRTRLAKYQSKDEKK